jgi:membrane protease YdiL (CAAX protease family)
LFLDRRLSRDLSVALLTAVLALGLGALSLVGPGLGDRGHLLYFVFTPTLAGIVGTAAHPALQRRLAQTLGLGPRPTHTVLLLAAGPLAVTLTAGVDMVPRLLLGGPLGEELGWRAVLLPLLWRRLGP